MAAIADGVQGQLRDFSTGLTLSLTLDLDQYCCTPIQAASGDRRSRYDA